MITQITREYENPFSGKKLETEKTRMRSIDVKGPEKSNGIFRLGGRYGKVE